MREDFQETNSLIKIEDIAVYLLGQPIRQMYRYPGERTASIKIYPNTRTFYDFGRGIGGDVIKLWSHVKGVNNWTALQEIKSLYGIEDKMDRVNIRQRIQQQEREREATKQAEKERKAAWRDEVDFWKRISGACDGVIKSSEPFSDNWCRAINQRQLAECELDCLCGLV